MKKKGSAIILAVLLLSFFTAIALAVFYLGEKKGERAYLKVQGEEVSNDIDMGSTLAYYEAYMAEQFVRKGKVYSKSHAHYVSNKTYEVDLTTSETSYVTASGTPPTASYFSGINLKTYIDYFSGYWDFDAGYVGNDYIPYIEEDFVNLNTTPARLAYREWAYDSDKLIRLWLYDGHYDDASPDAITIGGYRLEKLEVIKDDDGLGVWDSGEDPVEIYPLDKSITIKNRLDAVTTGRTESDAWLVRATYSKRIRLSDSTVGQADFKIEATHEAVIRFADADVVGESGYGTLDIEELIVDSGETIEELIIEKM